MCTCTKKVKKFYKPKNTVYPDKIAPSKVTVKNGWRLRQLFYHESLLLELGQDNRAKRMGVCGNTINVKVDKENSKHVLYEPNLRCKDRMCPVCNSYRASIMARKVEVLGSKMSNPHMLTVTASPLFRNDLKKGFENYKECMRTFKRNKTWFKKYLAGGVEHIEIVKGKGEDWHIHSHFLIDLKVNRLVENMRQVGHYKVLDPVKKELEIALEKCGLGTISDIRPVTEGYGKEISKYALKIGLDMKDDDIKAMMIHLRGKRMVSRFGNCYGVKDVEEDEDDETIEESNIEELDSEEQEKYTNLGRLQDVVMSCFRSEKPKTELVPFVLEAVRLKLIEFVFLE